MTTETNRITIPAAEEILGRYFPVLDHGFVSLVDYMGGDAAVEQATRVAYGHGTRKASETRGLLRYLHRHKHTSPNEMCELKFHCSMPIFVARQWVRHRTASLNEVSGRYSLLPMLFYTPPEDQLRTQSETNKQGRSDTSIENGQLKEMAVRGWEAHREAAVEQYGWLVGHDFARELAHIDLPLSTYTQWYWKIDMHNLLHFLTLRVDPHAQWEIQQFGKVMAGMLKRVAPLSYESWIDYEVCGARLSRMELQILRQFLTLDGDGMLASHQVGRLNKTSASDCHDLTSREVDELFSLFGKERAVPDHELNLELAKPASHFEEMAAAAVPTRDEVVMVVKPELASEPPGHGVLNQEIVDLEMSVRLYNCLECLRLIYLGSLVQLTEKYLLRIPNFGRKCLKELKELLAEKGLSLNTKLSDWKATDKKVAFNHNWQRVGEEFLTREQVLFRCGLRESDAGRVMCGVRHYFNGETLEYKVLKLERVLVVPGMEFLVEGMSSHHGG